MIKSYTLRNVETSSIVLSSNLWRLYENGASSESAVPSVSSSFLPPFLRVSSLRTLILLHNDRQTRVRHASRRSFNTHALLAFLPFFCNPHGHKNSNSLIRLRLFSSPLVNRQRDIIALLHNATRQSHHRSRQLLSLSRNSFRDKPNRICKRFRPLFPQARPPIVA